MDSDDLPDNVEESLRALGGAIHVLEVDRRVLRTRYLIETAGALHVEHPSWPVIVDGELAEQFRSHWRYDPGLGKSWYNDAAIRIARDNIRTERNARADAFVKRWRIPGLIIAAIGALVALWSKL